MKYLKRGLATFLILIMICGILGTYPAARTLAASKSSAEQEIARLEKDIEKWEKELEEYEKKADKATKGAIYVFYGGIEIESPLIIKGGLTNLDVPYLHVTNYNITFVDELVGAIVGYFRKLGTYTYEYKGQAIPDYEKVYAYEEERTQLNNKISKAKERLKTLKRDADAEFVLLSAKKVTLGKGQSFSVEYRMSENVSDNTITWSSSDKEIATVSKSGVIKAKGIGTAKITGKAKLNGKTITVNVTVKDAISSISLKSKSVVLASGETTQLKKTISPAKSYGVVSWLCSDPSVAAVDENGLVTAVAPGTAYIYAYTDTKKVSGACKITVKGDNITPETAASAAAAIAKVKDSGYLENETEYFFEVTRGKNKEYLISAYPITGTYLDIVIGASKTNKTDIYHESYCLKSNGKRVYFCPDNYNPDYDELESYSMLSGISFETSQISLPKNTYQQLILNADRLAQMDYIRITSAEPEIAEVAFSAATGKVYVRGISTGKTTVTAESKNGQKISVSVEVTDEIKTEAEIIAEAEETWIRENIISYTVEAGDEEYCNLMDEYLWWVNWYAADNSDKMKLYFENFEINLTYEEFCTEIIDDFGSLEEWVEFTAETFADIGLDQTTARENYDYYRNLYENGGEDTMAYYDYHETDEYKDYIKKVKEEYRRQQESSGCEKPVTAKTYQKDYKNRKYYSNQNCIPFDTYYILAEKDGNALVIAGYDWYTKKEAFVREWFIQ